MFKQILVPLDGSTLAEQALSTAVRIARSNQGSIVLLRVVSILHSVLIISPGTSPVIARASVEEQHVAEKYIAQIAASSTFQGIPVTTTVLSGSPASTILEVAKQHNCDLIVLSSHGATGMQRWLMGSVAQKIVRYSLLPTLVINSRGSSVDPTGLSPKRIIVPLDGSPHAEAVLQPAAELCAILAAPDQGILHLMYVVRQVHLTGVLPADYVKDIEKIDEEGGRAYLQKIEQRIRTGDLATYHLEVTSSVYSSPDVAETIIRAAESIAKEDRFKLYASDILALTTHGRSGIPRWFMGNTTERILGATTLPLLVVRPQEGQVAQQ